MAHYYPPFVGNLLPCAGNALSEDVKRLFCDQFAQRGLLNGHTVILIAIIVPIALLFCVAMCALKKCVQDCKHRRHQQVFTMNQFMVL